MNTKEMLYTQLAKDFSTSAPALKSRENLFLKKKFFLGRRIYDYDSCILQVLVVNGKVVFASTDAGILKTLKMKYKDASGAWFCSALRMQALNEILQGYGHCIADIHHYYLPAISMPPKAPNFEIAWLKPADIATLPNPQQFSEAIGNSAQRPDMLGVAALQYGNIIGIAAASKDSENAYQIGIDVLQNSRNLGVASFLTYLLKEEILRQGKLPFYGTVESHIASQNVAIKAGFTPAWWELYTKEI